MIETSSSDAKKQKFGGMFDLDEEDEVVNENVDPKGNNFFSTGKKYRKISFVIKHAWLTMAKFMCMYKYDTHSRY